MTSVKWESPAIGGLRSPAYKACTVTEEQRVKSLQGGSRGFERPAPTQSRRSEPMQQVLAGPSAKTPSSEILRDRFAEPMLWSVL